MGKIKINGAIYDWDTIVSYMDDDIREQIHGELAPCTEEAFWERYMELDPENEILDIVSPIGNVGINKFRLYQGGLLIREEDVDLAQRADLWPGNLYGIAGAGLIDLPVLEDCVGDDLAAVAAAVNDMLFEFNPVGLACGEIMAIDEYDIVYDPAGKRFLSTHDLDNDPVYIDWDGNDWRYTWLIGLSHIVEVEGEPSSLDTWDGRQWRHEEVGYHADYYRIDRLNGEPVEDKYLLRHWSQWEGVEPSGEIISSEELEGIKAKAGE